MDKKESTPNLEHITVLGKFSDGKIRQILTSAEQQKYIINLLIQTEREGHLRILETPLDGIEIEYP